MTQGYFDAPLFIREQNEAAVDITKTPFFYNDDGRPTFAESSQA